MDQHPTRSEDELLRKMWVTKSSRFNAYSRLKTKHLLSNVATTVLSFYILSISLFQTFEGGCRTNPLHKEISLVLVLLSVLLIIITLIESAQDYLRQSDRHHECARQIAEQFNKFEALTLNEADLQRAAFTDRYSAIINSFDINHAAIDFREFRLLHNKEIGLEGWSYAIAVFQFVLLWILQYGLYISMVIVPPLMMWSYRSNFCI